MRTLAAIAPITLIALLPSATAGAPDPGLPRPAETIEVPIRQPLTEPRVATHPGKRDHVLVAAILAPSADDDPWDCVVLATTDGANTWSTSRLGIDRCIDPWIVFTSETDVLFAGIGIAGSGEGDERLRLWLARSADAGSTWSEPVEVGRNYEHPIAIAEPGAAGDALLVSRRGHSDVTGTSSYALEFARVPRGSLDYDVVDTVAPPFERLIPTSLLRMSRDRVYATYNAHDETATRHSQAYGFVQGQDAPHAPITDRCAGPETDTPVFQGYPFAANGAGGLYHVCIAGDHRGVLFSRSPDGKSWGDPRRLGGPADGSFTLTPMLAANDRGHVLVGWQDRRDDPDCQRFTVASSANHGRDFAAPVVLDERPSCPRNPANGRAGRSWPGGGDYSSIDVDADGRFHVAWAAAPAPGSRYRLRYAVIDLR